MTLQTFYNILNVTEGAEPVDIKRAYFQLAMKWHPDKCGDSLESKEKFQEIQAAYETLIDPERRKSYDARLGSSSTSGTAPTGSHQPPPSSAANGFDHKTAYTPPGWDFFDNLEEEITMDKTTAMKEFRLRSKDMEGFYFFTKQSKSVYTNKRTKQSVPCPDAHIYFKEDVRQRAIKVHDGTWESHLKYVAKCDALAAKRKANKNARERGLGAPDTSPKRGAAKRQARSSQGSPTPPAGEGTSTQNGRSSTPSPVASGSQMPPSTPPSREVSTTTYPPTPISLPPSQKRKFDSDVSTSPSSSRKARKGE
ncbi:hypothetical protein JAAARDRAFT_198225 [Jaapia argillacea MUCL 33604]|uniref:J domain-containing protein n=1 Tax=Jaapia argillacea MUCL 33604 TaxID=933084 RepID=A0A067PMR6_9AGAM|nr:hypothetical protein JAAARDRAFT_198225 [Jaapia argillacea MUCL 33604]